MDLNSLNPTCQRGYGLQKAIWIKLLKLPRKGEGSDCSLSSKQLLSFDFVSA